MMEQWISGEILPQFFFCMKKLAILEDKLKNPNYPKNEDDLQNEDELKEKRNKKVELTCLF